MFCILVDNQLTLSVELVFGLISIDLYVYS